MLSKVLAVVLVCTSSLYSISINDMTLEEKIGQLMMVHFNGEYANQEADTLINEVHVGGIIYYNWSNSLHSPEQVNNLSSGLQELARQTRHQIPLLIAVDQEGGPVTRLKDGFTQCPSNKALALSGNPALAEQYALVTAQELRAVGVNMNLAPVVDVSNYSVIGMRSYGEDPETVITYAKSALEGYRKGGVLTSLKHFPGHGDVQVDSHLDLPVVKKSRAELDRMELLPFTALAEYADTVMTAHILVPEIDPEHCATASKTIINILREEIGFNGPIITDSLVMQGVLKAHHTPEEAAVAALNAGCDILLFGGKLLINAETKLELSASDMLRIHKYLVNAVQSGRISEERLNQSVKRVLTLKEKL